MNQRERWSKVLLTVGYIAMLLGAIDPMEGSLLILPGSGLVALGTFLAKSERRLLNYRVLVFVLIAAGVGAMWGFSEVGDFGGKSGLSMWWGMLVLPYLLGWSMGMWGPGSPRWLLILGLAVGLWYLTLPVMVIVAKTPPNVPTIVPVIVLGLTGLLTIGGCIGRLRSRTLGP